MKSSSEAIRYLLAVVLTLGSFATAHAQGIDREVEMSPLNRQFGILSVEPSGDGRYALVTTYKEVRVIDNQTGAELLAEVRSPRQQMFKIGSIDGRCVLAIFERTGNQSPYSIALYDVHAGKEIKRLQIARFTEAYGMGFSQNGRRLLLMNKDVSVFDTLSLTEIAKIKNPMYAHGRFIFIPGSHRVILSGTQKNNWMLKLWDYQSNQFVSWKKLDHEVSPIAVSPDGKTGAFCFRRGIRFFDLSSSSPFELTASINTDLPHHKGVGFGENGKYVWTANSESMQGWEVSSGKPIANEKFRFKCFEFSLSSKLQYVSSENQFALRELDFGTVVRKSPPLNWLRELDVDPQSAIHMSGGTILHWNRRRDQVLVTDSQSGKSLGPLDLPALENGQRYRLFSCGLYRVGNEKIEKYEHESNRFNQSFIAPNQASIDSIMETKNGGLVIACKGESLDLQFFKNASTPKTITYLLSPDLVAKQMPAVQSFDELCFSPSMEFVAVRVGKRVRVWDLDRRLELGEARFQSILGFNGNHLIGKNASDCFKYDWNQDRTSSFAPLTVNGTVRMVADGDAVASASNGFVRIWNRDGTKLVSNIRLNRSQSVTGVHSSSSGQHILVQFDDGYVGVWEVQ